MNKCLLLFIALPLANSVAIAEPVVTGNIISWPDDGYYQVQNASNYQSICEAGANCEVEDGEYIVINHTTGQRFEGIQVPKLPGNEKGFQIVGTTLVFPVDQWFQVQNASTYESLCNGLSECQLEPGTYNVINHSNGTRYEAVEVGEQTPPTTGTAPTVNGNTISWADDGWYQVQGTENYQSVCEGGRSCEVADGNYRVINLTTGVRYENIEVAGGDTPPITPPVNPGEVPEGTYPAQLSLADANAQVPDESGSPLPEGAILVGDVNGDGLEDLSVFLPGLEAFNNTAVILFADAQGSYPDLPLDTSPDAELDVTLTHGFLIEDVGMPVLGMGDVNNDGFDDLRVRGSGFFTFARTSLLAGASSFPARLNTDSLPEAQILVRLPNLGSFSTAGDINGDGIMDLLITAPSEVSGGFIYGKTDLDFEVEEVSELSDIAVFPGCGPAYSCSMSPIGDFDNDGYDDMYISRFGSGNCGFASYTAVIYGSSEGIVKRNRFTDAPASDVTRIVGQNSGNCFPAAVARFVASGDVDGDGAMDIILSGPGNTTDIHYLIFGMTDKRRPYVSVDELDGQRGVVISGELEPTLADINDDGFDDVILDVNNAYTGYSRDITSIDSPVVRRLPTQFLINLPSVESSAADRYQISINDVFAGEFDIALDSATVDDATDGEEAVVEVTVLSNNDEVLSTTRRLVPAFEKIENLTAALIAPRLVELTFNGTVRPPFYLTYLVWRDGVPVGRAGAGAFTYIDSDLELGTTYTYFVTPDYLMDKSLDAEQLKTFPLVQRQSGSVVVETGGV
ncbi:FG-GAP repeat protein [Granulosicoccus antarcticus]|uniref:FG-GAP repeat protein n=1 Tax=Granulosicoccus antarcticus IMCC3135 TaxID=1192854 RepID=A0A2Z2NZ60_9GAMM|nr:FG-GAP repeat protein [Granulosicoccus antarcticus]ASJ76746.1 hypothetical protein IMCC3135_33510 [Granulosicoccus antarcticus IMCC3135]